MWSVRQSTASNPKAERAARVDAALDGHLADAIGLAPVGNLDDALGERLDTHRRRTGTRKPPRQRCEARARARGVERDAAADQRRRYAAKHEVRVRNGRRGAAVRIAHRARLGAGALRSDSQVALAADPGDRAAAGADGLDVDHRNADREWPDQAAVGEMRLAAFDQAKISRGAAGIERHDIVETRDLGDHGAADGAGGRA